jgi:hypothetical protein
MQIILDAADGRPRLFFDPLFFSEKESTPRRNYPQLICAINNVGQSLEQE